MKTSKGTIFVGALLLTGSVAMGGYVGISYEQQEVDSGQHYKLFVTVEDGSRVDAVYGSSESGLLIQTQNGATFYQHAMGGNTTLQINQALIDSGAFPGVAGCFRSFPELFRLFPAFSGAFQAVSG